MKKREQSWTSKNMEKLPLGLWEIKLAQPAHPDRIYYKQFASHQISSLLKAKHQRLIYKIRDEGISQKICDGFTVEKSPAWCVLVYGKNAYAVDIDVFYNFCMREGNVSVKEPDAIRLGTSV